MSKCQECSESTWTLSECEACRNTTCGRCRNEAGLCTSCHRFGVAIENAIDEVAKVIPCKYLFGAA